MSSQARNHAAVAARLSGSGRPSVSVYQWNPLSPVIGPRTAMYVTGPCGSQGAISIMECSLVPLPCRATTSGADGFPVPQRATIGPSCGGMGGR